MSSMILLERQRAAVRRRGPAAGQAETLPGRPTSSEIDPRLVAKVLTIRRTEERLLDLFAQGKISGTVHTCIGQEWVGVAVTEQLRPGDFLFSNHRGHGHYIAWTDDVEGLIAELMGRATGVCAGRGGSQHLCRNGFFSNGIQGGIVPVSAGLAMAQTLTGSDGIAAVFLGDGTLGQGVVYETLNIASKWWLPLLLVLEDNGIAQSTEQADTLAGSIRGRARAFDIGCMEATTDDPCRLLEIAACAAAEVHEQRRPVLLHVRTRRLKSHSKGDDTRSAETLAALAAVDPINRLLAANDAAVHAMLGEIDRRLDRAIADASVAAVAVTQAELHFTSGPAACSWRPVQFAAQRINDAIRGALVEAMRRDSRIVLLGEDVRDPYGGAFRVTAGLSDAFGDRVRNTPISEPAIVGIANGLALAGQRPIVEIMFGDFLLLAADQFINHAAKFAWMYNQKVSVPLVIRTPMGGYRGYGPTHSQSLEKHLLGVPGTRVLALNERWCPSLVYGTLLESNDRPTLVVENKLLYTRRSDAQSPAGWQIEATGEAFPTLRLRPDECCQVTIVAYGGMVGLAEQAAQRLLDDEDLACEVLVPTQLYPLQLDPILESVQHTGRLLVIEEGQGFAGFAGEVIAQVACETERPVRTARVCAQACPIPAGKPAEQQVLPSADAIFAAARNLAMQAV